MANDPSPIAMNKYGRDFSKKERGTALVAIFTAAGAMFSCPSLTMSSLDYNFARVNIRPKLRDLMRSILIIFQETRRLHCGKRAHLKLTQLFDDFSFSYKDLEALIYPYFDTMEYNGKCDIERLVDYLFSNRGLSEERISDIQVPYEYVCMQFGNYLCDSRSGIELYGTIYSWLLLFKNERVIKLLAVPIRKWISPKMVVSDMKRFWEHIPGEHFLEESIRCPFKNKHTKYNNKYKPLLHCYQILIQVRHFCTLGPKSREAVESVKILNYPLLRYIARNEWMFDILFNQFAMNVLKYTSDLLSIADNQMPRHNSKQFAEFKEKNECVYYLFDHIKYLMIFPVIPWLDLSREGHSKFLKGFVGKYAKMWPGMYNAQHFSNRIDFVLLKKPSFHLCE